MCWGVWICHACRGLLRSGEKQRMCVFFDCLNIKQQTQHAEVAVLVAVGGPAHEKALKRSRWAISRVSFVARCEAA